MSGVAAVLAVVLVPLVLVLVVLLPLLSVLQEKNREKRYTSHDSVGDLMSSSLPKCSIGVVQRPQKHFSNFCLAATDLTD